MQRAMAYILKIYKKQSFSKAASELFITQPALSAIVKKEEQDYGVTLFNRSVKPIVPTEAGLKYIQTALKIERLETALRRELRSLSNTITIGSAAFFCANVLPPLIQQFLKETKNSCKVEVLEGNASELVTLLQNGDANFIITVDHNYGKGFQHGFLKKETVVLAVPEQFADSPELRSKALPAAAVAGTAADLSQYEAIRLTAFQNKPFILLSKGNDLYTRAHKLLRNAGVRPSKIIYMDQLQSAFLAANTGNGITFVRSELMNLFENPSHLLFYKIDDPLAVRDVNIVYYGTRELSPTEEKFLAFCESYFA